MPRRPRRQFTAEQKAATLRRHFLEEVPVSQLCEELDLQPSVFYYWQKQAFDNLATAVEAPSTAPSREKVLERENESLRLKLAKKDAVIAEISEEYVTLKKNLGSPDQPLGSP